MNTFGLSGFITGLLLLVLMSFLCSVEAMTPLIVWTIVCGLWAKK